MELSGPFTGRGKIMSNENLNASNKKAGKGNGNSVINNYEHTKNKTTDYVSGDSTPSSAAHKFTKNSQQ